MAKRATARSDRSAPAIEQALKLHQAGQFGEAGKAYAAILAADPRHFAALHLSGLIKYQQGQLVDALRLIAAALKAKPGSPDALIDYGVVLSALKRYDEALASFDRVLALKPADARLHYNRGNAQKRLGRYAEAVASYDMALEIEPNLIVAHHNRAGALAGLERNEEALAGYDKLLELSLDRADRIEALIDRGRVLLRLKRYDEALATYDQVLKLCPDHAGALTQRGAVLTDIGRPDEALAQFERALGIAPDFADAHLNRGNAFGALKRLDEALHSYGKAMELCPDHADANFNEALVRLCLGDYRAGWPKYEYRWKRERYAAARPNYPRPMWRGEKDIAGKTILLCAEQGLGDAIQFVRYAPLVAALGAKVLLGVHHPLAALLETVPGIAQVIPDGEALPDFDLYCSLLSLPLAFETDLATIPANIPYIRPSGERIAKWRNRMPDSGQLRVGICWAGTGEHPNNRRRSIALESFSSILFVAGIDFISLQKDVSPPDAAILNRHRVFQLGQEFADFADTAAVVAMLDLVISVDTSVAHLAGAMGKATAVLIAFAPDFRWMLDRTDSPWYPTMRLFRQTAIGDWDGPIGRLHGELAEVARQRVGVP